jgi:Smr domain
LKAHPWHLLSKHAAMKFAMASPFIRASKPAHSNNTEITATLDLHGHSRSKAISTLTQFLDQVTTDNRGSGESAIWVQVITGSGIHSTEGPVLRDAVKDLLSRRQMLYTLDKGKGSFTVKANSGQLLYAASQPTDTKVIVQPAPELIPTLPHQQRNPPVAIQQRFDGSHSRNHPSSQPLDAYERSSSSEDFRLVPAEVAAVDRMQADVRRVEVSFSEALKLSAARADTDEEKLLQQAMTLSMIEGKECEEFSTLQQALAISQQEHSEQQEEDEILMHSQLQAALERSERELSFRYDDGAAVEGGDNPMDELQQVLELSKKESLLPRGYDDDDDDDERLLAILQESKRFHYDEDERLLEILQESTRIHEQERALEEQELDELLQRALALSLQECKPPARDS